MSAAAAKWCVRRHVKDDKYLELLLVQGQSTIVYRGCLSPAVASCVGMKGRRSWTFLPAADASMFRVLKDAWRNTNHVTVPRSPGGCLASCYCFIWPKEMVLGISEQQHQDNKSITVGGEYLTVLEEQYGKIDWDAALGHWKWELLCFACLFPNVEDHIYLYI